MKTTLPIAAALSALAIACGPGPTPNTDGGVMDAQPVGNDFINVHCTSAGGEEAASACNNRLGAQEMGAKFFIGHRPNCYPNPNRAECVPLCPLDAMAFTNTGSMGTPAFCGFTAMAPGCRYNEAMGYAVVVETSDGRRAVAGVGNDGVCSSMSGDPARRKWALVDLEGLRTTAACARSTPMGGFSNPQFLACDGASAGMCAAAGTTCQTINLRAGMTMYTRERCTKNCTGDADCGNAGTCVMGQCFDRCGGDCSLSCPESFGCSDGVCLPTML